MNIADFLAWSPQDGKIWQLIDGEPLAMAPPSRTHGAIQSEISGLLRDPLLVIEILSPSNEAETWSNVWTYTTIPGLREIVVVHSTKVYAEVLRRGEDGNWPERPAMIENGDITLPSIGFAAPLRAFYRTTRLA